MDIQNIIIGPIITEKSMKEAGKGKFTFAVIKSATKTTIRKAINQTFGVNTTAIQTTISKGKKKRIGKKRTEVNAEIWKKAVISLKKGEKIDIFEAAGENN